MKAVEKTLKKLLFFSVLCSCLFVAGIPMIVVGASQSVLAVMIAGIVFTAGGFYGVPVLWVAYAERCSLKRIVYAVEKERLLTVQSIAAQLSRPEKLVRKQLGDCLRKGYLEGYVRQGDAFSVNAAAVDDDAELHAAECRYCGAKFSYRGKIALCPYCGAVNPSQKQ